MRYIKGIAFVLLLPIAGYGSPASTQSDSAVVCDDLLERGRRLTSIDDPDVYALGVQKLRQAVEVCGSPEVSPEARAGALMTTARIFSDDLAEQRQMWSEALSLLREHAPDSRLVLQALEGLSSAAANEGDYDDSLRLALETLEEGERLFGIDSREYIRGLAFVAVTYQGLAEVRSAEQNLAEAQRHAEEAMERARRVLGLRDGTTMTAAAVLRSVLSQRGFAEQAEKLAQETAPYADLEDPLDP